jgi:O-antigen ligase
MQVKWGFALYLLAYFMHPAYWWWGPALADYRWSLAASLVMLISLLINGGLKFKVRPTLTAGRYPHYVGRVLLLILLNMTVVHFALAPDISISSVAYEVQAKYVLLFFMALSLIRTRQDFLFLLSCLAFGLGYWGLEARLGHFQMDQGRLEGFGGPGCNNSNDLASFIATMLPVLGGATVLAGRYMRFVFAASTLLSLDIMMICHSRGGFLGLIAAGATLFALGLINRQMRKNILIVAVIGIVTFFLLARNPQIFERFLTTFSKSEDRDSNITSRLGYWKSGLYMIADYPLGSGGDAFEKVRGLNYRQQYAHDVRPDRDVHNGFLDEACSWGIQGLMLRMAFLITAAFVAWKTARFCADCGETAWALFGFCTIAATSAILVTSMFGTFLALEWGYLLAILQVLYALVCDADARLAAAEVDGDGNDDPNYP